MKEVLSLVSLLVLFWVCYYFEESINSLFNDLLPMLSLVCQSAETIWNMAAFFFTRPISVILGLK
jgi:hypothetical protein